MSWNSVQRLHTCMHTASICPSVFMFHLADGPWEKVYLRLNSSNTKTQHANWSGRWRIKLTYEGVWSPDNFNSQRHQIVGKAQHSLQKTTLRINSINSVLINTSKYMGKLWENAASSMDRKKKKKKSICKDKTAMALIWLTGVLFIYGS